MQLVHFQILMKMQGLKFQCSLKNTEGHGVLAV